MAERGNSASFLLGFLVGGLTGFALGVLFAPQPGSATREQLMARTEELRSRMGDLSQRARATAEEAVESARATLREAAEQARAEAERVEQELRERLRREREGEAY